MRDSKFLKALDSLGHRHPVLAVIIATVVVTEVITAIRGYSDK